MSTFKERAAGLTLWVTEGATPDVVANRLVQADRASFMWHVARKLLTAEQVKQIEGAAEELLATGYHEDAA